MFPTFVSNASSVVVTHGPVIAYCIYNGEQTRARLNTAEPTQKLGRIDRQVNFLAKISFMVVFSIAFVLLSFRGWHAEDWYLHFFYKINLMSIE